MKTKKEILSEEQKERYFTDLFNKCIQLMNASYRQANRVTVLN